MSVLFLRVDSVIAIKKRLSFEADQRFNVDVTDKKFACTKRVAAVEVEGLNSAGWSGGRSRRSDRSRGAGHGNGHAY